MRRRLLFPALAAFLMSTAGVRAAIIQDLSDASSFFPIPRDLGQSFTADASVVGLGSVGFFYRDLNTSFPNATVTAILYGGEGFGGTSLGSRSITIDPGPGSRYIDYSFAGLTLDLGGVYTVRFVANNQGRGGIDYTRNTGIDVYQGGIAYLPEPRGVVDLRFRVLGTAAAPEHSSMAMLGLGLVGAGLASGRRRAV